MAIAERLRLEGRKEGRKESQRNVLLKLLERRFGPLPEPVLERIRGAGFKQLDLWFDRGLAALNLRAVFADEPESRRSWLPDAHEALMTLAERLRREGRKEGRAKGLEEGRKKGREEGLREGRKKGREEGLWEGVMAGREETQRNALLTLLERRFGPLPKPVLERIYGAEFGKLEDWFERGITARSLRAVFADEP